MRRTLIFVVLLGIFFIGLPSVQSATTDSISQWGVTWEFDEEHEYGTFANGDYWVVGPVTITQITPAFTGTRAGWEVNPDAGGNQGFDTNTWGFDSGLVPSLPYVASAGQSLVKQVPNATPTSNSVTESFSVLTVVSEEPPGGGDDVFRPPYAGDDKSYYYLSSVKTENLLSLSTTSSGTTYAAIINNFSVPQIEIGLARRLRVTSPNSFGAAYGPAIAGALNAAIAKLNSADSLENKWPALIHIIQGGIDRYHCALTGQTWPDGAGHEPGHKLSVAFAAYMLDHQGMKDEVSDTFWYENRYIRDGLWGSAAHTTELRYWEYMGVDPGYNLERWDPYRYIDGGNNLARKINSYQVIVGQNVKGAACFLRYFSEMRSFWSDSDDFIDYAERWVNHGLKASPDPCAPMHPNDVGKPSSQWLYYGVTYGPDGNGGCIEGDGRFDDGRDGMNADTGQYGSEQVDEMWDLFEEPPELPAPPSGLTVIQ